MKISPVSIAILTFGYLIVLAGIIFVADTKSTQHLLSFIGFIPYSDKLGHFFLMGFLSFLVNLLFRARRIWLILLGSLIVSVVVTIEEISQIFVRGRSFDLSDLAAEFAGIIIFGEIASLLVRRFMLEKQR